MENHRKSPHERAFLSQRIASDVENAHREEPENPLHDYGTGKVGHYGMRRATTRKQVEAEHREQDRRAEQVHEQFDRGTCCCTARVDATATRSGWWRTPVLDDRA